MRALHKWVLSTCCALALWKPGPAGGREQLRTDHLPAEPDCSACLAGPTEGWGLPRKEGAQRYHPVLSSSPWQEQEKLAVWKLFPGRYGRA